MDTREETYHMTDKEMARLIVAERLIEGEISVKGAAEVLGISTRQVKRIKKKVRISGPGAIVHGNRKRKPANAVAGNVKDLVVELKREKYTGTNFSHFQELIAEKDGISISRPTVHRILRGAGIVSPKKKKKTKTYRYRKRKDCPGMMVQLDASLFDGWQRSRFLVKFCSGTNDVNRWWKIGNLIGRKWDLFWRRITFSN